MRVWAKLLSVICLGGSLVACSNDDDRSATPTPTPSPGTARVLEIKAALGALADASCRLDTLPPSAAALANSTTDAQGVARFEAVTQSGPFLVSCEGGRYYDEALKTQVNLPTGTVLRSLVPARLVGETANGETFGVAVTTGTDLAAAAVLALPAAGQTDAAIDTALQQMALLLGAPNLDLLLPPTTVNGSAPIAGSDDADRYATLLAGLAFAAQNAGSSAAEFGASLADAVAEGNDIEATLLAAIDAGVRAAAQDAAIVGAAAREPLLNDIESQQQAANTDPSRGVVTPVIPSPSPTPVPTGEPTPTPTVQPTSSPTASPTATPTPTPTPTSTATPTPNPTLQPTPQPTVQPTPQPTVTPTPTPTATPFELTVLHVNDHHSNLDSRSKTLKLKNAAGQRVDVAVDAAGFPRVTAALRELEAQSENVLKLHAGDALTGTLYFNRAGAPGEADAALMNTVCFDAMAAGNHEFDKGDQGLADFIDLLHTDECQTPVLSANLVPGANSALQGDHVWPSVVIERGGEQIGIVGLTIAGKTKESSSPDIDTTFENEVVAAQREIDVLLGQGVDKVIVLSHIGYGYDKQVLAQLSGVDIVVGGDSHTLLGPAELIEYGVGTPGGLYAETLQNLDGENVCLVQAWEYSQVVGELKVSFDADGRVLSCAGTPHVLIGDVVESADAAAFRADIDASGFLRVTAPAADAVDVLAPFKGAVDAFKAQKVAFVPDELCSRRVPGGPGSADYSRSSTACNALGSVSQRGGDIQQIVAQAYLDVANAQYGGADITLQSGGGVRVPLQGEVTAANVIEVLPFGNMLFRLDITASEVRGMIEDGLDATFKTGGSTGPYPYTGGLRFDVNSTAAKGQRASNIEFFDNTTKLWRPLDENRTYRLFVLSFNATGGDGYTTLRDVPAERRLDIGVLDADVFQSWIDGLSERDAQTNLPVIRKLPVSQYSTRNFNLETPTPDTVELELLGRYSSNVFGQSAAEIPVFDADSRRIFVVNAQQGIIDVLDAANPAAPVRVGQLSAASIAEGAVVNSVASQGGVIAVAIEAAVKTDPGYVAFYRASDLELLGSVQVGALPDMLTFTPDGKTVLVANEGEPSDDYQIDPEGSVSVIDVSDYANLSVRTADFRAFNDRAAELRAAGVRIFGPNASVAQDLEPEYIAVSADSSTAWATLQENNAFAKIDIATATVTDILPLGYKDHGVAGNGLDVSDLDGPGATTGAINIRTWPGLKGIYQPDAMAAYSVGGQTYLVTANEGDARAWGEDNDAYFGMSGTTPCNGDTSQGFIEEFRVKHLVHRDGFDRRCGDDLPAHLRLLGAGGLLNHEVFGYCGATKGNPRDCRADNLLGRLNVTWTMGYRTDANGNPVMFNASGDEDPNGNRLMYDELYAFGGRSFAIWDAQGALVWDSGDQFEQFLASDECRVGSARDIPCKTYFNSNHEEGNVFDNRSDNKGPEPEGVTIGQIGDKTFAFIGLERMGGVMVYDITDPRAPLFVNYVNSRDVWDVADPSANLSATGDLGAEGLVFVPAHQSPDGEPLLIVGNEVSGTTSVYRVRALLAP